MKTLYALAILTLISVQAESKPYGTAGCGLGNMVFPNKDNQILAATTNGTSGSQTFGITSGTSNCLDGNTRAAIPAFVESNRVALENDVARGNGDTLASLSEVLGCDDAGRFSTVLKANYSNIFTSQ